MINPIRTGLAIAAFASASFASAAFADTISPTSFSATLKIGESVTIRKTVTVTEERPTTTPLDVMFLIDTTGSMSGAIAGAKAAAGDILTGLSAFGDLESGAGVFGGGIPLLGAPSPGSPINSDLNASTAVTQAAINATTLGTPDGGGDFPERGQDAVKIVAENADWRPGSKRVIIALGDSSWNNNTVSDAQAKAALDDNNVDLIGLRFSNFVGSPGAATDDSTFTESVEDLGGTVFETGTDPADIVAAILAGIGSAFDKYTKVGVDDFGAGLPGVDVSTVCVSAAAGGACVGDEAVGDWDRSAEREFEFDVTFKALADGVYSFDTYATVDGVKVAAEADRITVAPIPVPASLPLLLGALGVFGLVRRRKAA